MIGLKKRPAVFVGAGLGDVARRFYQTNTYQLLDTFAEPAWVLCFSHNPSALDFFRFHPNAHRLLLIDAGNTYMALLRDRSIDRSELNQRVFDVCGFAQEDFVARSRAPEPIGFFHAPDTLRDVAGHIVLHPFGRGWGNWPEPVCNVVRSALREVAPTSRVFVLCATHITTDGRRRIETFACDLPNVTVLENLSAPAAFSLVASAARFIGSMSALAQVAAFENVPSLVLHPARCTDFQPPYSPYSKTIWNANGLGIAYDLVAPATLREALGEFLASNEKRPVLREMFAGRFTAPAFP